MRRTVGVCCAATAAAVAVAWRDRPRPTTEPAAHQAFLRRVAACDESALLQLARSILVFPAYVCMRTWMLALNRIDLHDAEKMHDAVLRRSAGRGLVTVCNHCSVLDDPGLLCAGILPLRAFVAPSLMRWGLCAERVCFERGSLAQTFFGACRGLPISRFGGINQPTMRACAELVRHGEHLHIFPEGRIYQDPYVPRDEQGCWTTSSGRSGAPFAKLGPLRRGVGKVVADATVARRRCVGSSDSDGEVRRAQTPLIVPFFHLGMEGMAPVGEDRQSRTLRWGAHVIAKVGDPIDVDDLIDEFEARRSALIARAGAASPRISSISCAAEEARLENGLHTAITGRIEGALLALERDVRRIAKRDGIAVTEPAAGTIEACHEAARESNFRLSSTPDERP